MQFKIRISMVRRPKCFAFQYPSHRSRLKTVHRTVFFRRDPPGFDSLRYYIKNNAHRNGVRYFWWTRRESNPRPLQCECSTLPTELRARALYIILHFFSQNKSKFKFFYSLRFTAHFAGIYRRKSSKHRSVGCYKGHSVPLILGAVPSAVPAVI